MKRFKITLGDRSNDGHGMTESFIIKSNKSVVSAHLAYNKAKEITGVDFNNICRNYEDSTLDSEILIKLEEVGIDMTSYKENPYMEVEDYLDLLLEFIKLGDLEITLDVVEDKILEFNEYLGYGLFSN